MDEMGQALAQMNTDVMALASTSEKTRAAKGQAAPTKAGQPSSKAASASGSSKPAAKAKALGAPEVVGAPSVAAFFCEAG